MRAAARSAPRTPRRRPAAAVSTSARPRRTCRSSRTRTGRADRNELERLEAEAERHRNRLTLYRQRSYGRKAGTERLRALQLASDAADAR